MFAGSLERNTFCVSYSNFNFYHFFLVIQINVHISILQIPIYSVGGGRKIPLAVQIKEESVRKAEDLC